MADSESIWHRSFPYLEGDALVRRLEGGWRLSLGPTEIEAPTLIGAFETFTKRRVGDAELRVVLAALAWDDTFGSQATPSDRETHDDALTEEAPPDPAVDGFATESGEL